MENVNHPKHYNSHPSGVECIDIIRWYPADIANVIKYVWRAGLKEDASLSDDEKEIEDVGKSAWYSIDRIYQLALKNNINPKKVLDSIENKLKETYENTSNDKIHKEQISKQRNIPNNSELDERINLGHTIENFVKNPEYKQGRLEYLQKLINALLVKSKIR